MSRPLRKHLANTLSFDFPFIADVTKPSVTLHKNGPYLLFKANDTAAADVLREVKLRMECGHMREGSYFGAEDCRVQDFHKVELWKHLKGDIGMHPFCSLLRTYGVEVGTSSTLRNYILREYPRRQLEATPYPASPVVNDDVSLFGRCHPGASLFCITDFTPIGSTEPIFKANNRYLVTSTGGEGIDKVAICTEPISHKANLSVVGRGRIHEWTEMDLPMETWFDDSESVDFGQTLEQKYPERVKAAEARLAKVSFIREAVEQGKKIPLYEHVRLDAVLESLKRGVVNCKLMRMGKTGEAITICELWDSKKIGVIGSKNVRLAWRKEFRRLGMSNFVFVNRLSDLDKEGKYYLFTLDWLKQTEDPSQAQRKNSENYLRASERVVRRTVKWDSSVQEIVVFQHNTCPYCQQPLERPLFEKGDITTRVAWTTAKGYLCRNSKCVHVTDNQAYSDSPRKKTPHKLGAAWAMESNGLIRHKAGSYVDEMLARHAQCSGSQIKGRLCCECGATDSTWTPPRYKRVKDLFSVAIGDEIHNAKDGTNQQSRAMFAFRAKRRIAMTGTLLSNSPLDAYWPLHWAVIKTSEQFPWKQKEGKKTFETRFCDFVYLEKPTGDIDEETGLEIIKTVKKRTPFLINPPDWWRTMQPMIVRRNYSDPLYLRSLMDAGMKLPRVSIRRTLVPMHPQQVALMLDALRDFRKVYEQMVDDAESTGSELNKALVIAKMTSLRTIATCPERMNQKFGREVYTGPAGGGKMLQIVNLVTEAIAEGKKVFILSDFIEMQIQVEKALAEFSPIRMMTSWGDDKRDEALSLFASDPTRHCLIAGTRAVREAVDASVADVTICTDLLWSPAWQVQAWSRTMAPTSRDRDCVVYPMLSQNSLDEYIYTVFYGKLVGAEQAMDRKIMHRRALDFDVKFFAQRVLEEEEALTTQLRDYAGDDAVVYLPEMEMAEERAS